MTNIQSKVPQLRFSEFSDSWETKTIKDIAKIERGRFSPRPRNNPKYYGGDIPFVQTSDVTNSNGIVTSYSQTLNELGLKVSKKFPKGTILITIAANIGYCGVLQEAMACPDSLIGINCYDLGENEFLCILLNKLQPRIDYLAPQAAQKNINIEFLNPYRVKVPETPEKQKIASFLSAVDNKISLLKQKHEQLMQYKKGIMQQIFSQKLRFKDDNGQDFPNWEVTKFKQHFERVTQKNKINNLNVLTISGKRGLINQQKYFNKSVAAQDLTGYYLLNKGEFAYNKSYSKGYPMGAIKRLNNYDQGVVSTLYICFKSKSGDDRFWEQYFEAGLLNREIQKIAQEGARNHGLLNVSVKEFFDDMNMHSPSENEQTKIADFLESVDKKINLAQQQIEQTQAYKQGLLQQMFV